VYPDTSPSPLFLTRVRDRIYFAIHDEMDGGWQLWQTDGTAGGTTLLARDLGRDVELSGFGDQVAVGVRGGLWMSDGTVPGTRLVKNLPFFPTGLKGITGLRGMDDVVLFSDGNGGLWRSDGTEAGTIPVIDLKPGGGSFPGYFRVFQKRLFFSADGGKGFEPWVSDGTTEGTISLGDLNPTGSSYARHCQRRHRRRHPPRDRRRSHQRHPTVLSHQSG
jgi:ELWxxDGT repeat protein